MGTPNRGARGRELSWQRPCPDSRLPGNGGVIVAHVHRSHLRRTHLERLIDQAGRAGIQISQDQCKQFAVYHELLEEHRKRANLTAITGLDRVRDELFARSLEIAAALTPAERARYLGDGKRLMDVGTGAGFPGLPMAIVFPATHVTLLDGTRKKTDFLAVVVEALGLEHVEVVNGRAEELARNDAHRESYDIVTSRALAALPELAELTLPFCKVGGMSLALKGANVFEEAKSAASAAAQLGASTALLRPVALGPRPESDTAILWRKVSNTPARFPRRTGIPHKRPIGVPGAKSAIERDDSPVVKRDNSSPIVQDHQRLIDRDNA